MLNRNKWIQSTFTLLLTLIALQREEKHFSFAWSAILAPTTKDGVTDADQVWVS